MYPGKNLQHLKISICLGIKQTFPAGSLSTKVKHDKVKFALLILSPNNFSGKTGKLVVEILNMQKPQKKIH